MKCMLYPYGLIALTSLMVLGPVEASLSVSGTILAANVTLGQHISHLMDGDGEILANASSPSSITTIIPPNSRLFDLSLAPIQIDPGIYYVNATVELENSKIIAWRNAALEVV